MKCISFISFTRFYNKFYKEFYEVLVSFKFYMFLRFPVLCILHASLSFWTSEAAARHISHRVHVAWHRLESRNDPFIRHGRAAGLLLSCTDTRVVEPSVLRWTSLAQEPTDVLLHMQLFATQMLCVQAHSKVKAVSLAESWASCACAWCVLPRTSKAFGPSLNRVMI